MADSFVQLPADGAGKKLDTRTTTDGDHREVIILGVDGDALIGGDATNGLDVDVTRLPALPAGTNNIGDVDVLSVPAPLSSSGGGTEAAALRVTLANDSTGLVSVDDNGGSLTVDGTVSVSGAVDTELPAAAALADNTANPTVPGVGAFGMVFDGSTWDRAPGTSADGLLVNLGANNDVTDGGGSLTVDAPTGTPVNVQIGDGTRQATVRDTGTTDSLNVAIVDASGNQITSFGGGTQYTEDDAAPANPVGTAVALVRDDAPNTQVTTDGDIVAQRGTNYGAAYVQVVTSAGAFVDAFGGSGGTAQADESAFTEGTTNFTPIGGVLNDTITSDPTEDQAAAARITAKRGIHVNLRNVGGTEVGTAAAPVRTDPTGSTTQPVSAASLPLPTGASTLAEQQTQTTALQLIDDVIKTLGTDTYAEATTKGAVIGAVRRDADTSPVNTDNEVGPLTMDANGRLKVEAFSGETLPVSVSGVSTLAEQQTQTTHLATIAGDTTDIETAVELIDDTVATLGTTTYAEATSKGLIIGAIRRDADTTAVNTDNEIAPLQVDANGRLKVEAFSGETLPVSGTVTANQGTAGTAWEIVGDVAADIGVPANPVAIGGRASTAVPTAVSADGDSVYTWLNRNGLQVVSTIPGAGLNADPYTLLSETAQYTTTQTSAVLVAGGASERIVVTSIQIQAGGTTAGTCQVYFGTGAYARGTDEAIFDGEFAPSSTLKPGFYAAPPSGFRAGALGDDILVTTSAAINPLTITVWYYILGV